MNATENNERSREMAGILPALQICFEFVDGSRRVFIQHDLETANGIRRQINPFHLFNQARIVVADDYSKSVFVCSQINRIDLIFNGSGFPAIPPDHADLIELDEAEFQERVPLNELTRLERRDQPRQVGDLMVSFLDLMMVGGTHVYLMNETLVKLPLENHSFMQRLLSKGPYCIRHREGGIGVLNTRNLIGYTVYPGVPEVPADTWMAQPAPLQ
ncbi:MAG: hypothetical protein JWM99_19 [Verrucomicrobiales bacterium]|nr:hypothetical protein [Verrucomicrobiales bacterium]